MVSYEEATRLALEAGFDAVGICRAAPAEGIEAHYREWIARGYHGEMGYLTRNMEKRLDPTVLVPGARSVVSVLLSYNLPFTQVGPPPRVARFAWLRDYHQVLKDRLFGLLDRLRSAYGPVQGRAFVDSAPFLDRYWAARGGLGWIGKHSLLVSPEWGSFVFIGSLVIDLEIEAREHSMPPRCGRCTRCIDACPTKALLGAGVMNATRCISYLTIEKKSPLTAEEEATVAPWAFGCDVCQEVCPWNRRAKVSQLAHEMVIDRELLARIAAGESPPDNSPMLRADPHRLRRLLGLWQGLDGKGKVGNETI